LGYGAVGGGGGHGGGGDHGHGQPSTYHYQVYPGGGGHSSGYGVSGDDHESGNDFGGGGGPIGLLGLLGLKGLKGLGVFKIIKALAVIAPALPILAPILLPILAPLLLLLAAPLLLLLLLPLLLLFIPIPVITVPGRSFSWRHTARMAQDALTNEECFERITCEAVRVARGYGFDAPWMKNYLEKSGSKNKWVERISRAAQTTECKKYTCGLVNPVKKVLKMD